MDQLDKMELIKLQFQQAKSDNPIILCGCKHTIPLRFMYRCYFCGQYFCESCAPIHFGKTREEYHCGLKMKKGDPITVTIGGRRLQGIIEVASRNGRSIAALFDEGVPMPFSLLGDKQCVLIFREEDGTYIDLVGDRPIQVHK